MNLGLRFLQIGIGMFGESEKEMICTKEYRAACVHVKGLLAMTTHNLRNALL